VLILNAFVFVYLRVIQKLAKYFFLELVDFSRETVRRWCNDQSATGFLPPGELSSRATYAKPTNGELGPRLQLPAPAKQPSLLQPLHELGMENFCLFLRSYNLQQETEMRNETVNINLRLLASESHSRIALNPPVSLCIKLQCWWKFPEFEAGAPRRKRLHPVTRFLSFSLNSLELCIDVLQPRVIVPGFECRGFRK
jgi:hypothetical protein